MLLIIQCKSSSSYKAIRRREEETNAEEKHVSIEPRTNRKTISRKTVVTNIFDLTDVLQIKRESDAMQKEGKRVVTDIHYWS